MLDIVASLGGVVNGRAVFKVGNIRGKIRIVLFLRGGNLIGKFDLGLFLGDRDVLGHIVVELIGRDAGHAVFLHLVQRQAILAQVVFNGLRSLGFRILHRIIRLEVLDQRGILFVIPILDFLLGSGLFLICHLIQAELLDLPLQNLIFHHLSDVVFLERLELISDLFTVLRIAVLRQQRVKAFIEIRLGDGLVANRSHDDLLLVHRHQRAAGQHHDRQSHSQQSDKFLHVEYSPFLQKAFYALFCTCLLYMIRQDDANNIL